MKLLAVNICNLNSLVGVQSVDFREEPLATAGLYAIVGPTGAGKSTILDAITLALYGRTERDTYGAEVMSHGTGECFAEVIFETREGTFLSRWERRRARQRPDGNLQTAQLQLSRYDPAEDAFKPMAGDRLGEVKELVRDTIGLDYDQFVRSVMLTQGQFARFLASSTKERADILEKITGTAIYSRISEAAFERNKQARDTYEQLRENQRHVAPLTDPDRAALENRQAELEQAIAELRPRMETLRTRLSHHAALSAAEAKYAQRQAAWSAADAAWQAIADRRDALDRSLQLAELREPLAALDRLRKQTAETEADIVKKRSELRQLVESANEAEALAATAKSDLDRFTAAKPAARERLEQATQIENQQELLRRESTAAAPELMTARERGKKLDETLRELQARVEADRRHLAGQTPEHVKEESERLESELDRLVDQRDHLTAWIGRLRATERLGSLLEEQNRWRQSLAEHEKVRAEAAEAVGAGDVEVTRRRAILQRLRQTKGVEHLRADLAEGDPCPLCGATHHPVLHGPPVETDAEIALAAADLHGAEDRLKELRAAERRAADAEIAARSKGEELAVAERETRRELAVHPPEGEAPAPSAAEAERQLEEVISQGKNTQSRLQSLRQLRKAADRLTTLNPQLLALHEQVTDHTKRLTELNGRQERRTVETEKLRESLHQLIGNGTVAEARRRHDVEESTLRQAASERSAAATAAAAAVTTARDLVADRATRLADLEKSIAEQQERTSDMLRAHELPSEAAARALLLPPRTEETYREDRDARQLALRVSREALDAAAEERARARDAVRELPDREAIAEELAACEQTDGDLHRDSGAVRKELQQDDERRFSYGVLRRELERADGERQRWSRLNDLIGQKDGVKFSRFAQTLTLQRLVEVGNRHLRRINERYRMRHRAAADLSRELLELEIIDTFQNDNCRSMSTLSGGETFIVSLALALGLSELASGHTNIQSLFIDEGFGTLDEKILDDAVSALEQLQGQGKTIGLISHVKELQERIYCQIRLVPRGGGRSQLVVTPAVS